MTVSRRFRMGLSHPLGWAAPALAVVALVACDGGVVIGEPPGEGGGGAGGGASSASSVSAGGGPTSVASSGSTSTSGGSGGGGGGWDTKEACFGWDAGPCPPKEEAVQYMSQCGFSIYSVDEGPFEKDGMCCYLVSGVPNPC